MSSVAEQRCRLRAAGFSPLPIEGKRPPMKEWEKKLDTNDEEIALWDQVWQYAHNTGFLTRFAPVLDVDILSQEGAKAVEALVRDRYETDRGCVLVRIGKAPKRAIPFRTNEPFKKVTANLIAPDGSEGQKLELLADGQQVVAFGIHPETRKPYSWFGGEPGEIKREDLPYLSEADARQLVEDAVELLVQEHGYRRAGERPKKARQGNGQDLGGGVGDWGHLAGSILAGRELHDGLRNLAGKLIASGMGKGAAVNLLRGLMQQSAALHDDRWQRGSVTFRATLTVHGEATPPPSRAMPHGCPGPCR
jgi:hypothetical protein